jgi:translation initiation factor IF-3
MHPREALEIAETRGLDLVEVAPTARPPVCRIMDFGKYQYQQSKKAHEARKSQKTIQVKEVKFRPKIDPHDFEFKKKHAMRFLKAENKVKATVMFRGREVTHPKIGEEILLRLAGEVEELADIEVKPKMDRYTMTMILAPKKSQ